MFSLANCTYYLCLDEIKWQIRMPERFAMREESLIYNDKIQEEILNFMGK